MSQRIKGQETELIFVLNGQPFATMTDFRSFEFEFMLEILREGYLGETTDRRDSIFKGVRGSTEMHFENETPLQFFQSVVDKARRRTTGTKVNVKTTLNFPNGDRPRILIPDVEFGAIPMSFGSRSDYGTVKLDYEAAQAQVIF